MLKAHKHSKKESHATIDLLPGKSKELSRPPDPHTQVKPKEAQKQGKDSNDNIETQLENMRKQNAKRSKSINSKKERIDEF